MNINKNNGWDKLLKENTILDNGIEKTMREYLIEIEKIIEEKSNLGTIIYPNKKNRFRALNLFNLNDLKVVILGQDPYHGEGQADGLCFSLPDGNKLQPSLRKIYKTINSDLGIQMSNLGNLEKLAKQGILLLNTSLSVEKSKPNSHKNIRKNFTDNLITIISETQDNIIFLLWGAEAKSKIKFIDEKKHKILKSSHPQAYPKDNTFLKCKHFSKTNDFLKQIGKKEIDWKI